MLERLKNRLLALGPHSVALRQAFRLQAASRGIMMRVSRDQIFLRKGGRVIILSTRNQISVPFLVRQWELFFDTVDAERRGKLMVLDFSKPGLHRYPKSGLSLYCPGIAEDDCMDAYTSSYRPRPGDIVWDVGAHAGMTSYFFAQMVGPEATVYAFEPDDTSYECLLRNIEALGLANVIPVKAALSDSTGTASFVMDGSMGAGLSGFRPHAGAQNEKLVQTLSLADACEKFGCVPQYVKMDIEGAEINVVASALEFLKEHPIHLSIESNHLVGGKPTSGPLEELLNGIGYRSWSSTEYGQLFTWAEPTWAVTPVQTTKGAGPTA